MVTPRMTIPLFRLMQAAMLAEENQRREGSVGKDAREASLALILDLFNIIIYIDAELLTEKEVAAVMGESFVLEHTSKRASPNN